VESEVKKKNKRKKEKEKLDNNRAGKTKEAAEN